jgi:hypothetical protein
LLTEVYLAVIHSQNNLTTDLATAAQATVQMNERHKQMKTLAD